MYSLNTEDHSGGLVGKAITTLEEGKPASQLTDADKMSVLNILGIGDMLNEVEFADAPEGGYEITLKENL